MNQSLRIRLPLIMALALAAAALLAVGCAYPNHRLYTGNSVTYSQPEAGTPGIYEHETAPQDEEAPAGPAFHEEFDANAQPGMVLETSPADTGDDAAGVAARAAAAETEAVESWKNRPDPFALPAPEDPAQVEQPAGPPPVVRNPDELVDGSQPGPTAVAPPAEAVNSEPVFRPAARTLSQTDLINMHEAGLSDATILAVIKASYIDFQATPQTLIALGRAGLSDTVLQAVIDRAAQQDAQSGR